MYNNYNGYNPYFNQQYQPQNLNQTIQRPQMVEPTYPQTYPQYPQVKPLQGKMVDSVDVVKATEANLDGSISYYPLADGSAIVTKQIGLDGKSKIITYKPIEDEEKVEEVPKYITQEELESKISDFNIEDIKLVKEDIKKLKRGIEDLNDLIKEKKGK